MELPVVIDANSLTPSSHPIVKNSSTRIGAQRQTDPRSLVAASVTAKATGTPTATSASATAAKVDPVVSTSSTSTTAPPSTTDRRAAMRSPSRQFVRTANADRATI